jgi:hypothetical protein
MKKKLISMFMVSLFMTLCQPQVHLHRKGRRHPPPPNPSQTGGGNNLPVGGGAPIGSGLAILLALGAAYGWKKAVAMRKADEE